VRGTCEDGEVEGFGATGGINVYDVIIGAGIAADNRGSATIKERRLSCCLVDLTDKRQQKKKVEDSHKRNDWS